MVASDGSIALAEVLWASTDDQELGGTLLGSAIFCEDVMRGGNVTHAEALSCADAGQPRLCYGMANGSCRLAAQPSSEN